LIFLYPDFSTQSADGAFFMHPQSGILPLPSRFARFLVIRRNDISLDVIKTALHEFSLARSRLQSQDPAASLATTLAFGGSLWLDLQGALPAAWHELRPLRGKLIMPAESADLFVHIHSERFDFCYELAQVVMRRFAGQAQVLEECAGFRYLDSRDLTGFIDGTENPQTPQERAETALLVDAAYAGCSFVFAQRYVHHLDKWQHMTVAAQEQVIGRSKLDSIELAENLMPENSHVSRNIIEEDGDELAILRHSLPYGDAGSEHGLFFLAYTRDLSIIDRMLARMFGASEDGISDRLLNFTTPVGGAYFFAPSEEMLASVLGGNGVVAPASPLDTH
jgi:porphyrinogen peroxidase